MPITKQQRRAKTINDDHVPPKAVFPEDARNWPLILDTHEACNGGESRRDEAIAGVLQTREGVATSQAEELRVSRERFRVEGSNERHGLFDAVRLEGAMWRWMRGFHAALYGEYLPADASHKILPPFPMSAEVDGKRQLLELDGFYRELTLLIKGNRRVGNLDCIESNNGMCLYNCVWRQVASGQWEANFALKVCDWEWVRSTPTRTARGCVGFYSLPDKPPAASTASAAPMAILNADELDPFGR